MNRQRLRLRRTLGLVTILLLVEFLDEFIYGINEAAWPQIRTELALTYAQIGLLQTVPAWIASFLEPVIGILGDVWRRRILILLGAVGFGTAVLLTALAHSFWPLMFATVLFYPSSGALVNLSQAALMDGEPQRHEQNMARWTFAGSAGVVIGAFTLSGALALGLSWRSPLLLGFVLTVAVGLILTRFNIQNAVEQTDPEAREEINFFTGLWGALRALRRGSVLRWLVLLEFSDLMMDTLHGFLALYFVDVVFVSPEEAAAAVAVWTGIGLIGDFLLIPLLERVRGLDYLRVSAAIELMLFPAFLLVPGLIPKMVILALLGFFNAGWFSILQGQLYTAMPGQSGSVMTVGSVTGFVGSFIPLIIGAAAEQFGLGIALWLCLLGPIALLVGLPRKAPETGQPVSGI